MDVYGAPQLTHEYAEFHRRARRRARWLRWRVRLMYSAILALSLLAVGIHW